MHKLFIAKRFIIFTAVLFSAILPLDALPVKLLKQNFETNNFSGQPTGTSADGSSWKIHPLSHQIVDADGSQALQISRNPDLQGAEFHLSRPANGQVDFSIKFKLILHAAGRLADLVGCGEHVCIGFLPRKELPRPRPDRSREPGH